MMDFPWIQKKDPRKEDSQPGGPTSAEPVPRPEGDPAVETPDQLGQLEQMLHAVREQVARVRTTRSSADAVNEKLELLLAKLETVAQ
ncbi:MAG: hypothetical protein WCL50_06155, partial [Spirochaetota bacterium]